MTNGTNGDRNEPVLWFILLMVLLLGLGLMITMLWSPAQYPPPAPTQSIPIPGPPGPPGPQGPSGPQAPQAPQTPQTPQAPQTPRTPQTPAPDPIPQ